MKQQTQAAPVQTEAALKGDRHLVGHPIRMQDGAFWTVPAMPIAGDLSDRMVDLCAEYWAALGELSIIEPKDYAAKVRKYYRPGFELACEALRINYPAIEPATVQRIVSKRHLEDIVHAIQGTARIRDLVEERPAGNAAPAA